MNTVLRKEWFENKDSFEVVDVRKVTNAFLKGLLKKASGVEVGKGLCVVQTFEPKPLYAAMEEMGYETELEVVSKEEYRAYFYRASKSERSFSEGADMPFKPTAILNYKNIDNSLATIAVNFWQLTWEKENAAIDLKTKLMLSMVNAMGAGRHRQATREIIKAYSLGLTVAEMDEIFELIAWNQGIGTFSSEFGPSSEFKVYQFIKNQEQKGLSVAEVMKGVMENFGDTNPQVNVKN
jgi:hypothetical protein